LENVTTLVLSFGDEKTIDKDEYLLANPIDITVIGSIFWAGEIPPQRIYFLSSSPNF